MKVQDLIAILQSFPPETLVLIPGYESGFNELTSAELSKLKSFDPEAPWYEGQYTQWVEPEYGPSPEAEDNVPDPSARPLNYLAILLKAKIRD